MLCLNDLFICTRNYLQLSTLYGVCIRHFYNPAAPCNYCSSFCIISYDWVLLVFAPMLALTGCMYLYIPLCMGPFLGKTDSRQAFRKMFPESPTTNDGLETQQRALLMQQEEDLNKLKSPGVKSRLLWRLIISLCICITLAPLLHLFTEPCTNSFLLSLLTSDFVDKHDSFHQSTGVCPVVHYQIRPL